MSMEKSSNLKKDPGNMKNSMENKKSTENLKGQSTSHKSNKEKKVEINFPSNSSKEKPKNSRKKMCTILCK